MEFKERLKSLRKENKLTQSTLANFLNYGYTAISNYESGRYEPSIKDLKKIAKYFDVSMDYLLCVNDIKNPYIESEYPKQFDDFKNIYSNLSDEKRQTLDYFMHWLLEEQQKEQKSVHGKIQKVAQEPPVYKTKNNS